MAHTRWIASIGLLLPLLVLLGCGTETPGTARVALDTHRSLGSALVVGNLTVWPVHTDQPLDIGEFHTLTEAQSGGTAIIREVGTGDASQTINNIQDNDNIQGNNINQVNGQVSGQAANAVVNTLVIENKGALPILVCAGTIVDGGKQDRQIGQDFVIAAGATVDVDAYCVEQGRWQVADTANATAFKVQGGIALKGVRSSGQYDNDQSKVWKKVSESLRSAGVESESGTLLAAKEQADKQDTAEREDLAKRVLRHFAAGAGTDDAPVGFAYAVNGKMVTVRTFAHARLLKGQLPAFVEAMAMEARLAEAGAKAGFKAATGQDVVAFVAAISAQKQALVDTKASNFNGYRKGDAGFNAACYLKSKAGTGAANPKAPRVAISEDWSAK